MDFLIKHFGSDGGIPCIDFLATHDFKENFGSESHSVHETVFPEMLSIINILKERSFQALNLKVVTYSLRLRSGKQEKNIRFLFDAGRDYFHDSDLVNGAL
ncbi:hypothetical protein TNCT_675381 [Trichonephila clavata]|nr:hypothetical protein TNCT_675381 [Trichonephila clavata]